MTETMNHEVLRRLRAELWQAPRPHGDILRDRSVGPLELFYDLVVVVLVGQAAHRFSQDLTAGGLARFAAVFAIVWIAWLNGTLHHELHGREDVRARNTFLAQVLLLVPLGAFIPGAGGALGRAFAIDAALLFGFLAFLWWRASRGDTADFAPTSRLYVWATLAIAGALAGSAALSADLRPAAWAMMAALYLLAIVGMFATASPTVVASLVITESLAERFGAFVIIVLGETVTGVVTGLAAHPTRTMSLAVGLTAILVGFGSWWTYFDFVAHREPRASGLVPLMWILGHLPISAAIAGMGAAMTALVTHAAASRTDPPVAWVLGGGAVVILVFIAAQITCLAAWNHKRSLYRPLAAVCVVTCPLSVLIAFLRPAPEILAASLVLLFGLPWTFAVIRRAKTAE